MAAAAANLIAALGAPSQYEPGSDALLTCLTEIFTTASTAGPRQEALKEFKHVLTWNRNRPKQGRLDDDTYRDVIAHLGGVVISLRSTFLLSNPHGKNQKGSGSSTFARSKAALATCATAMRLTSESGVRTFRAKTVRFILDHILQTLPNPDNSLLAPIADEYVKSMRVILAYPPHVEHLTRKEWKAIVSFCTEAIKTQSSDSQPTVDIDDAGTPRTRTPDPSTESTGKSFSRDHQPFERPQSLVDNLVTCLHHLVTATNAPLQQNTENVLSTLITWLQSPRTAASAHVDAFAAINAIFSRTSLDSMSFTHNAIQRLIPVLRNFWSTKLSSLKDEMLITLIFSRKHIYRMLHAKGENVGDLRSILQELVECMRRECGKRLEREQLQIDDLRLRCSQDYPLDDSPFTLPVFRLKPGNVRTEHNWTVVYFIADLSNAIKTSLSEVDRPHGHADVGFPNKRQRTLDYLQDSSRQVTSSRVSDRLLDLQAIAFMVQQVRLSVEDIQPVLEKLTSTLSDGDSAISNWAAIGTARYIDCSYMDACC